MFGAHRTKWLERNGVNSFTPDLFQRPSTAQAGLSSKEVVLRPVQTRAELSRRLANVFLTQFPSRKEVFVKTMVLRQLGRENARKFVQPQVCNKANCLPYPFALIIAIRITESEKRFISYSSQSFSEIYLYPFISSEVCKSSHPRFLICGFLRSAGIWRTSRPASRLSTSDKCSINFELYTNLKPQPEIWTIE